ncbi:MAG: class II aldolase/adducin family protein [Bacillota bacterium]
MQRGSMDGIVEVAHRAHQMRLTPGTSGNISVRSPGDGGPEFMISASGVSLGFLDRNHMVSFPPASGEELQPSSEIRLHAALYRVLPQANVLLHYHGTWTILAGESQPAGGTWSPSLTLPEFASLAPGGAVPVVSPVPAGSGELAQEAARLASGSRACGLILSGHGGITWGRSARQALFHAETLESAAKIDYLMTIQRGILRC